MAEPKPEPKPEQDATKLPIEPELPVVQEVKSVTLKPLVGSYILQGKTYLPGSTDYPEKVAQAEDRMLKGLEQNEQSVTND